MKILIYSPAFYPNIGGIETMVAILANEFARQGHEIKVVSQTPPGEDADRFTFDVVRRPNSLQLAKLLLWCDVYFQPNVSLRGVWPLALLRRPWVISHQSWYTRSNGNLAWQDRLKHFFVRFATNVSASQALADHLGAPSAVIPNAFDDEIFRLMPEVERRQELVFVGRLVSDKGAALLIEALALMKLSGLEPNLTVVGQGPEEAALRHQVDQLGLAAHVTFAGVKRERELAELLNAHRIMVVPSRWHEPFGIVALEGIACGCVVVGSEGGGLKDAVGPCGVTFANGDAEALARALSELLVDNQKVASLRASSEAHLARHRPAEVAGAYLQVFEKALEVEDHYLAPAR